MNLFEDLGLILREGQTLPASWYTDPTGYGQEMNRIFRSSWQFVGLTEQVAEHGAFMTCQLGDIPVLIVRDHDDELRAFINVCRHRGSQLVLGTSGCRKSLQCHYHAWTYGLDGRLLAAPGSKTEPGFSLDDFSLFSAQVGTWGPFVFVNPDLAAPPLADVLGDLPQLVAATGIDVSALRGRKRAAYDIESNWKVVVDNYLECYHCPTAHPAFSDLLDLEYYTIREYDHFSTQSAPAASRTCVPSMGGQGVESGFYVYLWPTFMLNIYPGPGNVSLNVVQPLGVGRTRVDYQYCFVDEVEDATVSEFVAFIDQIQQEDTVLCEAVQRGLRSGFFDRGRLLLTRERALQHFQLLVYRYLSERTV